MLASSRAILLLWIIISFRQPAGFASQALQVAGQVIDENGAPVAGAIIALRSDSLPAPISTSSDEAGRFSLPGVLPGTYELRVSKVGFYVYADTAFHLHERSDRLEVTINHRQEFEETVHVEYSPPLVDRQEPSYQSELTTEEIVGLPYPATHDFRNALPLNPGIVKDNAGRLHMNGGGENQAYYVMDGFDISDPVSGILEHKIPVEGIRNVRLENSRYSSEYGKGSAGVMSIETSQGDDRYNFSATNFVPSFEIHNGLGLSNWNPRFHFSGPIVRERAWFFDAADLQYEKNVVDELPAHANTNVNWTGNNLTRFQINPTRKNILSTAFLFNFQNSPHAGISTLDPLETSRNLWERFYFVDVKDQAYLAGGWVLETGIGLSQLNKREQPQGSLPYRITPEGRSGNYFKSSDSRVERMQILLNVLSPAWNWHGRHAVKFGMDANRIRYRQRISRREIEVYRLPDRISRQVGFSGSTDFGKMNAEFSAYFQDRWTIRDQVLVDLGMRLDWDQVLREPLTSPRLAVVWGPARMPGTKFSAGIGIFHDAVNLDLLTRSLDQTRSDTFYADDGMTVTQGPVRTRFVATEANLKPPYYLNWSLGWEQELPAELVLRANLMRKTGHDGWVYRTISAAGLQAPQENLLELANARRDSYYQLEWTLNGNYRKKYPWLLSYVRSSARSSAVIDFSLDNLMFGPQGGGPLDWDAPNRLISWASLPVPFFDKYTLSYFLEWHSGFPFSVVDGFQRLVGSPNERRFPDYFSLNLHIERRFRIWGKEWALRAGFNNVTGHSNPNVVNNNLDSPDFGEFSGGAGRVFTGRIRFIGRN